ncbi:hypothetical protein PGTUg99_031233 [Puccinia graminis f. sp. tritici]|uniref:Integrase core domain-containing protein n=1 Tax=Puccinia graminis f. sp. tritici TaxID=56615 RepID=A0A5B0S3N9_PUCGR|nr:hypothetical protein PGTUg99_031233 [Puccinia graminis f. sp. tritici]
MILDYEQDDSTHEPDDWPTWRFRRYIDNKLSTSSSAQSYSHWESSLKESQGSLHNSHSSFGNENNSTKTMDFRSSEEASFPACEDQAFIDQESNEDPLTSDYTEESGSDDESFVTPEESEIDEPLDSNNPEDIMKYIVKKLLLKGHKGPKIVKILKEKHGISISYRTLARRRAEWGLQRVDLPLAHISTPLDPPIRASLLSSHRKGLNLDEIQARLVQETGVTVCIRTVKRYLQTLQLKLLENDVQTGKVSMDEVFEAINHARTSLLHTGIGYRRMRFLLMRQYNIRIPRQLVYDVLKHLDPAGMAARLRQGFKRRIYRTYGPNHIWACDGHDKLKPYGICVYGFVDAWLRKILGMFVHTTNNDPQHVGLYFLHLASKTGGLPLKVTSDYGTETVEMATYQMWLSYRFGGINGEEATKRMHFTKSNRNQKIESLWSQMMKQHNRPIIDSIVTEIENGYYNPDDEIEKLLFLFLWIPVFQSSVNIWVDLYNNSKRRRDYSITLPTACSPDYSYGTPEAFGTTDQLVNVPSQEIELLIAQDYPNCQEMFQHTPEWFRLIAERTMQQIGVNFSAITVGNVWIVFQQMLPSIRTELEDYTFDSSSSQSSQYSHQEPEGVGSIDEITGSSEVTCEYE